MNEVDDLLDRIIIKDRQYAELWVAYIRSRGSVVGLTFVIIIETLIIIALLIW